MVAPAGESFHLKWDEFPSTMSSSFSKYKENNDFCDVTIACDDKEIQVHKVIISAGSLFFERILRKNSHPHPWLYLSGVKSRELEAILEFMYSGETKIAEDNMVGFLEKAKELEIQGLSGWNGNDVDPPPKEKTPDDQLNKSIEKEKLTETTPGRESKKQTHDDSSNINVESLLEIKDEPAEGENSDSEMVELLPLAGGAKSSNQSANDDSKLNNSFMEEEIMKSDGVFTCKKCGKTAKTKQNIRKHIEIHLEGQSYPCYVCGKEFKTNNSLHFHISKSHRA